MKGVCFLKLDSRKFLVFSRCIPNSSFHRSLKYLSSLPHFVYLEDLGFYRARLYKPTRLRNYFSQKTTGQSKKQEEVRATELLDSNTHQYHTTTILQRLQDLEESFRVQGHSILRWGLSALVISGFFIYIFREPLRENVADEVADVASRSLGKANLKKTGFARLTVGVQNYPLLPSHIVMTCHEMPRTFSRLFNRLDHLLSLKPASRQTAGSGLTNGTRVGL